MMKCIFKSAILLMVTLTAFLPLSYGQVYDNFPTHVSQSFAFGVTHNSGLSLENIQIMAATVAKRNLKLNEVEAKAYVVQLPTDGAKKLASQAFYVDYTEIPLKTFQAAGATFFEKSKFLQDEASPLIFKKGGVDYVRWFFHPLRDPKSFLDYFPAAKLKSGQFLAQLTESRSVVVMDRKSGNFWSMKLSLPQAVGVFVNKKFLSGGALIQLKTSDYLAEAKETNFIFEQEALGIKGPDGFDEGILVRSIQRLFANGQYVISFSAIFTHGLKLFLQKVISPSALEALEKKWLAGEPGKATAERFFNTGLIHNSNHTQNSTLIFSAEGKPIAFKHRDADFYADDAHARVQGKKDSLWFLDFSRKLSDAGLEFDYSMPNGLKDYHYGYQINQLTSTFFESILSTWDYLNGNTHRRQNIYALVHNETYYQYKMSVRYLSADERKKIVDSAHERKEKIESRFSELKKMNVDPFGSLRALLLRKNFAIADLAGVFQAGRSIYGNVFIEAWNEVVREFMDPEKRATSIVMEIIRSDSEYGFRNFALMVIYSYEEKFEKFVEELFIMAARYPRTAEGLKLVLNQFSRIQYPGIREPLYYSRIISKINRIVTSQKYSPMKCEMLF